MLLAVAALAAAVLGASWLRTDPGTASFFADYPGVATAPPETPEGFPAWLSWAHFLNSFLLVFIVSSGLRILSRVRPPVFVTRRNDGPIRTRGKPRRLSLHTWWHLIVDSIWVVNGIVYVVLLFASGHWLRLVPLNWDVVPNAVSAGLQYLSLEWPLHDSWVHYNALQQLLYAFTVFVVAPLSLATGLRLSPAWPERWKRATGFLGDWTARKTHFWIMVYFIGFTIVHVTLVLATGALRNLNHMYAGRDDESWVGFGIFALSVAVMVIGWLVARPAWLARLAAATADIRE